MKKIDGLVHMKKLSFSLYVFILFCFTPIIAQNVSDDTGGIKNLPALPFLPDPLVIDEGNQNTPVTNLDEWKQQKEIIRNNYQHYVSGTVPPPPDSFQVYLLSERKEGEVLFRKVELRFGPQHQAKMTVEMMIPYAERKLPVFMTQWNHRGWAQVAVRRGYIGCVYAGADAKDDTKNYDDIFS